MCVDESKLIILSNPYKFGKGSLRLIARQSGVQELGPEINCPRVYKFHANKELPVGEIYAGRGPAIGISR
jgi:hypothetical protein